LCCAQSGREKRAKIGDGLGWHIKAVSKAFREKPEYRFSRNALKAAGHPAEVALTAVMRNLLVTANTLVKETENDLKSSRIEGDTLCRQALRL
jgi:hypothetical protein